MRGKKNQAESGEGAHSWGEGQISSLLLEEPLDGKNGNGPLFCGQDECELVNQCLLILLDTHCSSSHSLAS